MDVCAGGLCIVGNTRIVPRMLGRGAADEQSARLGGSIRSYVDSTISIIVDHSVVVIPEHIDWWLRAGEQSTHQAESTS